MTITFCATGKTGLGHLRRVTNIAQSLRDRESAPPLMLVSNAPVEGLTKDEAALYRHIEVLPRTQMSGFLMQAGLGPVVVDTAVLPGLARIGAPLCLILRQTAARKLSRFRLDDDRQWDLVILPNPVDEWQPNPGTIVAERLEAVGWIYRRPTAIRRGDTALEGSMQRPCRILVASGGGGNTDTANAIRSQVAQLIQGLRETLREPLQVLQVLGPRASAAARINGVDGISQAGANLHEAFSRVDLVISTVGYNSVLELACTDVPTLLLPIPRTYDDQEQRALRWAARLGLAHSQADLQRSIHWMAHTVAGRQRRSPVELGPSGAKTAATLIEQLCT